MQVKTVTFELPEMVYRQAEKTAAATAHSLEEVLARSVALSLPPLEEDLSEELLTELSGLMILGDEALWQIARSEMPFVEQDRLEELTEIRKERDLTESEAEEFEALFTAGEHIMLKKAEAYRLLTRRGFTIPWLSD